MRDDFATATAILELMDQTTERGREAQQPVLLAEPEAWRVLAEAFAEFWRNEVAARGRAARDIERVG